MAHLHLTPLERLALVHAQAKDERFDDVINCYASFLDHLAEPSIRSLIDGAAEGSASATRDAPINDLMDNGLELGRLLTRFFLDHRGRWNSEFTTAWLF